MIKLIFLFTVSTFLLFPCDGQIFCKASNHQDFQDMLKNGVTYIKTGDAIKDKYTIEAFEKNWNVSEFKVFDPEAHDEKLSEETIIAYETSMGEGETILAWIKLKYLLKGEVSRLVTIGYIYLRGFNGGRLGPERGDLFMEQAVGGFNGAMKIINNDELTKGRSSNALCNDVAKAVLPKSKILQEKTLLIVGASEGEMNFKVLESSGIKYKKVTEDEYAVLREDESNLSDFCLFYFSQNTFVEISIFDLETNEIIFTEHYVNGKAKFGIPEINKIKKTWL